MIKLFFIPRKARGALGVKKADVAAMASGIDVDDDLSCADWSRLDPVFSVHAGLPPGTGVRPSGLVNLALARNAGMPRKT